MKLQDIVAREAIVTSLESSERDGVIGELVEALISAGVATEEMRSTLISRVIEREEKGSTGFGKGVAVPHVKHDDVPSVVAAVGVSEEGVDFNALDRQPVYSFILLLSPSQRPDEHLEAMNLIFKNLSQAQFRRFLRQASTVDAVVTLLQDADNHELPT